MLMDCMETPCCDMKCAGGCRDSLLSRLLFGDSRRPAPGPEAPSGREMQRYLLAALLAGIPCLAAAVHTLGSRLLAMFGVALIAGLVVECGVARIRRKPLSGGTPVYALLFALILPPTMPLWMVGVGMAFGTLFGKEVFGGTGSHIFSPPLVAKGFLLFSYPTDAQGAYFGNLLGIDDPNAWLIAAGLTLIAVFTMAGARAGNLNALAGLGLGSVCVATLLLQTGYLPRESVLELLGSDGILFGACFLATDPGGMPRSDQGKWLYGLLIGAIVVLMRSFSTYTESMLCAVLIGNLFAPTIDALGRISLDGGAE